MRRFDRLLLHRHVQRLGGVQALVGGALFVWGILSDVNPLIAGGALLLFANLALLIGPRIRERRDRAKPSASPPVPAQDVIDSIQFPRRDDRAELAARCERFAVAVEKWVWRNEQESGKAINKMAEELAMTQPELDESEARQEAERMDELNRRTDYALRFRAEAKELFDKAYEMHEISKEVERTATQPFDFEFGEIPTLFRALARRLSGEAWEPPKRTR